MEASDRLLVELRARIAAADRRLLEVVNERLELVRAIREHKHEHGVGFVDTEQERRLIAALQEANPGPLSAAGVEELLRAVLDLTKRESA